MATAPVIPPALIKNSKVALTTTEQIQGLRNMSTGVNSLPAQSAQIAERHQNYLDGLSKTVQGALGYLEQVSGFLGTINTSPPGTPTIEATLQEVAIPTAMTTNIVPAVPVTGTNPIQLLFVVLTCDATGGGLITWDATGMTMKNTSVNDIINGANQLNIYVFLGRADLNWWRILSMLGVNP